MLCQKILLLCCSTYSVQPGVGYTRYTIPRSMWESGISSCNACVCDCIGVAYALEFNAVVYMLAKWIFASRPNGFSRNFHSLQHSTQSWLIIIIIIIIASRDTQLYMTLLRFIPSNSITIWRSSTLYHPILSQYTFSERPTKFLSKHNFIIGSWSDRLSPVHHESVRIQIAQKWRLFVFTGSNFNDVVQH